MKRYSEYKDSGVAWIGKIPVKWNVAKIAKVYQERKSKVSDADFQPLSVTMNGILPQIDGVAKTINNDDRKLVRMGDFVINSRADRRGACGISKLDGSVSLINIVLEPLNDTNNTYYNFVFRSKYFADEFFRWGSGIHDDLWSTKWGEMRNILIPVPPQHAQAIIADYLDATTGIVDTLITVKQKLIELLKEKRQAIISEAVTKGLDPTVPMKDSGIEWIGRIPITWQIAKLKNLLSTPITDGPHETPTLLDEGVPFLSAESVKNLKLDFSLKRGYISREEHARFCIKCKPQQGDIFIIKSGATTGNIAMVETSQEFSIWSPLALIRCNEKKIDRFFMFLFLQSYVFRQQVELFWNYGTQQNIGMSVLENLHIAFPSINIQKEIAAYVNGKASKIDNLIADIATQIEKLKEYRQAIISEAVTGKIMIAEEEAATEQQTADKRKSVFKRLVLSAYVLDNICDEPTAGRVKFEKLLHLSEYCARIDLQSNYKRYAAGPLDSKALHSIEQQLQRNSWFGKNTNKARSNAYVRLGQCEGYKKYIDTNFDIEQKEIIDKLLQLLRTASTEQCEIIATLYGAWNDFLIDGIQPTDEQIVTEVLTNWHESKERIDRQRWHKALNWMREKDIIPVGYGSSTKGGQN